MQIPRFDIGDIIMLKKQFVTEVSKVVWYSIDNEDWDVSYILETWSTYSGNRLELYQKSSQLSSEIIQSEDKPIANEHDFWEAIMLLKDVRQYATDMTSHADSYEAQSAYKKYKKLLSILENKIFTI